MNTSRLSRYWLRAIFYLSLINLLVIAGAILGRMLVDFAPLLAFRVFFYGAQLGIGLAALGLLSLVYFLFKKNSRPLKQLGLTVFGGLFPLITALVVVGPGGFSRPMIHDISTDTENPPEFVMAKTLRSADENSLDYAGEEIAQKQREAYPDIEPLTVRTDPAETLALVAETANKLGWTLINSDEGTSDPENGHATLEAYEQTKIFGFIDDVSVRITRVAEGSRIDVRSVSRVGLGDLGANAARIQRFLNKIKEQAEA